MERALGIITGVIAAGVIVAVIWFAYRKNKSGGQFDERQLTLRAKGMQRSFFVTLIAEAAALFLVELDYIPLESATLAVFIALMIGIVTFAVFCISKDVFFRVGEKGTYYLILSAAIVVMNGASVAAHMADGSLLDNGRATFEGCSALVMAVSFLVIFIALLIRRGTGDAEE